MAAGVLFAAGATGPLPPIKTTVVGAPPFAPAPTTAPIEVVGPGGTCRTYRVRHGGEAADTEATWESLHFNEAAVQFYLMLGR